MNFRTPAVRLGLLPAGIAIALTPAFASAQDATAGATTLDRLEVTGSRIRGANMETQQPILTLTRENLEKQGYTSVADVLQNMTSAGSPARIESKAAGFQLFSMPSRAATASNNSTFMPTTVVPSMYSLGL